MSQDQELRAAKAWGIPAFLAGVLAGVVLTLLVFQYKIVDRVPLDMGPPRMPESVYPYVIPQSHAPECAGEVG